MKKSIRRPMAKGTVSVIEDDTSKSPSAMRMLLFCGMASEKRRFRSGKLVGAGEAPSLDFGADLAS